MKAQKENKVYSIKEEQKEAYLKQGYTILDDKGKVLERSHLEKVPYKEYEALKKENETLKKENEALKKEVKEAGQKSKGRQPKKNEDANNQSEEGTEQSNDEGMPEE